MPVRTVVEPLLFLGTVALYYLVLARVADRPVLRLVLRRRATGDASVGDVLARVDIAVAAIFQLVLVATLSHLFGVPARSLLANGWTPALIALSPALALAELSAAAMLAGIVMAAHPAGGGDWRTMMDSGWLRSFLRAGGKSWRLGGVLVLLLYIGAEEFLFRAVGLHAFAEWGTIASAAASTATFLAAQCAGMPSLRHALFPLAGAAVMGPVHAALALAGAPVSMLILVHFLFFVASMVSGPRFTQPRAGVSGR